jgi:hypothetical protein
MARIIFSPRAVYLSNGAIEVLAGVPLSDADVQLIVNTANVGDPYNPVFLIHNGGHRQRLSAQDVENVLAEPLAAHRAKLAQEAAEYAAAVERAAALAAQEAEAKEAAALAVLEAEAKAIKTQFQNAIG